VDIDRLPPKGARVVDLLSRQKLPAIAILLLIQPQTVLLKPLLPVPELSRAANNLFLEANRRFPALLLLPSI